MKNLLDQLKLLTSFNSSREIKKNEELLLIDGKNQNRHTTLIKPKANNIQKQNNSLEFSVQKNYSNDCQRTPLSKIYEPAPEKKNQYGLKDSINDTENKYLCKEKNRSLMNTYKEKALFINKNNLDINSSFLQMKERLNKYILGLIQIIQDTKLKLEKMSLENSELKGILKSLFDKQI